MIIRLDGGYLKGELLTALIDKELQLSQGVSPNETHWQQIDENTRLYDAGQTPVVSTCSNPFRVVLVEKKSFDMVFAKD